jgi:hypothetical protein
MKLPQGVDKMGGGAFPPPILRMEVFASFFKKKRLACAYQVVG